MFTPTHSLPLHVTFSLDHNRWYMPVWLHDPTARLVIVGSYDSTMTAPGTLTLVMMDQCYPQCTSQPSCIKLPEASRNNYELKPQFITMLPKFHGMESEDAYMFISEFEEVCAMLKIQ